MAKVTRNDIPSFGANVAWMKVFHIARANAKYCIWKRLPRWLSAKGPMPMKEMLIRSLDQEDPLEEEMIAHSSIHAGEIPWTEQPGWLQSMGSLKSQTQMSD